MTARNISDKVIHKFYAKNVIKVKKLISKLGSELNYLETYKLCKMNRIFPLTSQCTIHIPLPQVSYCMSKKDIDDLKALRISMFEAVVWIMFDSDIELKKTNIIDLKKQISDIKEATRRKHTTNMVNIDTRDMTNSSKLLIKDNTQWEYAKFEFQCCESQESVEEAAVKHKSDEIKIQKTRVLMLNKKYKKAHGIKDNKVNEAKAMEVDEAIDWEINNMPAIQLMDIKLLKAFKKARKEERKAKKSPKIPKISHIPTGDRGHGGRGGHKHGRKHESGKGRDKGKRGGRGGRGRGRGKKRGRGRGRGRGKRHGGGSH